MSLSRGILLLFLLSAALFCGGCGSPDESAKSSSGKTPDIIGINETIRVLPEADLAALGPVNKLETKYVFPNADFGQLIRPVHFLQYQGAKDVLRYLELVHTPFILMDMFDQIDYMILSTKVIQVELLKEKSSTLPKSELNASSSSKNTAESKDPPVKERMPFAIQSVYIKMKKPVDQNMFFTALAFSKLDKNKTKPKKFGELEVYLTESAITIPTAEKGRSAKIPDHLFSLAFPTKDSVVFATGPKRELDQFYSDLPGPNRGIIAQKIRHLEDEKIDFAWIYDYSLPSGRICALPFPEPLASAIFENAHSLDLMINATAPDNTPLIKLNMTSKSAETIGKIDQALSIVLTDLVKQTSIDPKNMPAGSEMIPVFLKNISNMVPKIKKDLYEKENKLTAVLNADADARLFFSTLFTGLKSGLEDRAIRQKEFAIKLQLNSVRELLTRYYSKFGKYPPAAICDKNGKPLLSWRVELLQVMGKDGEQFYKTFKLDEPWNSDHNSALMYKVPNYYRFTDDQSQMFKTVLRIFNSPNTPWGAHKNGLDLKMIENPGKTFLLVTVDQKNAVEWTRPDDLAFEKEKLGEIFNGSINGIPFLGDPVVNLPLAEAETWITGKQKK